MDFIGDPFVALQPYFLAAAFALARMLAMMIVFPVFDRLGVTGLIRNGIALVLSIPLIPMIAAHLGSEKLSLGLMAALLLKEIIVGLIVGLVLAVPLYAAEVAGDIVDLQRGSSSASLSDPLGTTQANITGTLLALIVIALYFASGCFDLTLRAIYDSYGIWPVRRLLPMLSPEAGQLLLSLLDTIVRTGLVLVGPFVVSMLLVDLLFALIARAAPSLQPFYLSMTVKNLVFSLVLVLYGAFLVGYMKNGLVVFLDAKPHSRPSRRTDRVPQRSRAALVWAWKRSVKHRSLTPSREAKMPRCRAVERRASSHPIVTGGSARRCHWPARPGPGRAWAPAAAAAESALPSGASCPAPWSGGSSRPPDRPCLAGLPWRRTRT